MPTIPIALVQCDLIPERRDYNLDKLHRFVEQAASLKARWVVFHEGTLCDYARRPEEYAERVPAGEACEFMTDLARRFDVVISFGLPERDRQHLYITQAFVGPPGLIHRYRKTWLWREPDDSGYRNEWARFDPGTGPEFFLLDDVGATCFICADGEAPRCISRASQLGAQVAFYPNNRRELPSHETLGRRAADIGAALLVTNRVGKSWIHDCQGGCAVYSSEGELLAAANREGREEILIHELRV